jgi:hypothetical protein
MKELAALIALMVAAGTAQANLRVYGSYWDAGDLNEGYGGGVGLRAEVLPFLGIDIRGTYIDLDNEVEVDLIPLEASVVLQLPTEGVVPYGGIGAGYYMFDEGKIDPDDKVGIFAVLGIELGAADGIRFFAEGRWVALDTDFEGAANDFEDLDLDDPDELSVDGLGINIGIVWDW